VAAPATPPPRRGRGAFFGETLVALAFV
jgi:hypothetical protein